MLYVLNERDFINNLTKTYVKPNNVSIYYLATLLAKNSFQYTNLEGKELVKSVLNELAKFNIFGYEEYLYADKVKKICNDLLKNKEKRLFKELDYIPIYQSDIASINRLPTDRLKKLMFTLVVCARYCNCDGWTNKKTLESHRELFKQANISCTSNEQCCLLHELKELGYISFAKSNTNLNIKITQYEHDDYIAYRVTSFEYLGNQYIGNFKPGYSMCENCHKIIKVRGNRHKYCKRCKDEMQLIWQRQSMKKIRENK